MAFYYQLTLSIRELTGISPSAKDGSQARTVLVHPEVPPSPGDGEQVCDTPQVQLSSRETIGGQFYGKASCRHRATGVSLDGHPTVSLLVK